MNTISPVLPASVPSETAQPGGAGSITNTPTQSESNDFASLLSTGAKNSTRKAAAARGTGTGNVADAAAQGSALPVPGNLAPPLPPGLAAQAAALLAAAGAAAPSGGLAGAAATGPAETAAAALQIAERAASGDTAATATAGPTAGFAFAETAAMGQAEAAAGAARAGTIGATGPASPLAGDASAAAGSAAAAGTAATRAAFGADEAAARDRGIGTATDALRTAQAAVDRGTADAASAAAGAQTGSTPSANALAADATQATQAAAAAVAHAQAGNGPDATTLALSAGAAQAGADRSAAANLSRSADRAAAQAAPSDAAAGGALDPAACAQAASAGAAAASSVIAGFAAQMTAGQGALERHGRGDSVEAAAVALPQSDNAAATALAPPAAGLELSQVGAPQENLTRIDAGINTPEFSQAIADHVSYLAANNLNGATLQVTPPQLGPIELRVTVEGNHAQVWLSAHNPATLDALQASSAKLREMLGTQGFSQVNVEVSQRSFQDRSAYQQSAPWTPPAERDARPAAAASAATGRMNRAAPGALDAYA